MSIVYVFSSTLLLAASQKGVMPSLLCSDISNNSLASLAPCSCSPAGTYSAAGAGSCIDCPAGQYNPSTGLADQSSVTPGVNCLRCPGGSIALANGETMPEFDDSFDTATADYRNEKPLSAKAIACAAW